jgi:hypothetical protein
MNYVKVIFVLLLPSQVLMYSDATYLCFDIYMGYNFFDSASSFVFIVKISRVLRNEDTRVSCSCNASLSLTFAFIYCLLAFRDSYNAFYKKNTRTPHFTYVELTQGFSKFAVL